MPSGLKRGGGRKNNMSIIFDKVSYTYNAGTAGERQALKNVSFKIDDGEFVGLIGHTGSGKSTLIQHMNGLLLPTSGAIYYNGEDICDPDFDQTGLRSKVGLVFQYPEHQLFESTIFEDVCFGPKNQGLTANEAGLRAIEALKLVGMPEELYYQSPFELSGGQKRRVAIAGVLAMRPEVLVLDEPAAGLDPQGCEELMNLLTDLNREKNMTIVMVSHSMEDVADYVSRILVVNDGGLFLDGTPREVFQYARELEQIGLAAPEVTYLMHDLAEEGWNVRTDVITVEEAYEEILAAIRRGK